MSGWAGPAEVCDLEQTRDGISLVRWHGRVISCAVRDVRRALVMLVMLTTTCSRYHSLLPSAVLRSFAESLDRGSVVLGYVLTKQGWS